MTKPETIVALEKHLGIELLDENGGDDYSKPDSYTLNGQCEVAKLVIRNAAIADFACLKPLHALEFIELRYNAISDFSYFRENTNLHTVRLIAMELGAGVLPHLAGLRHIKVLDLEGNGIGEIASLNGFEQLTTLILTDNPLNRLPSFEAMTRLRVLHLGSTRLSDIAQLETPALSQLETLWAPDNAITRIPSLKHFARLRDLDLSCNQITDLSPLADVPELARLKLNAYSSSQDGDFRADVSALQKLTTLEHLELDQNNLVDISALHNLKALKTLSLKYNKHIRDVSGVWEASGLEKPYLDNNAISRIAPHYTDFRPPVHAPLASMVVLDATDTVVRSLVEKEQQLSHNLHPSVAGIKLYRRSDGQPVALTEKHFKALMEFFGSSGLMDAQIAEEAASDDNMEWLYRIRWGASPALKRVFDTAAMRHEVAQHLCYGEYFSRFAQSDDSSPDAQQYRLDRGYLFTGSELSLIAQRNTSADALLDYVLSEYAKDCATVTYYFISGSFSDDSNSPTQVHLFAMGDVMLALYQLHCL